jgi:Leucine-rich repeat (LRR) protein
MSEQADRKPWRRRLRVSVRSLTIVVLVVGCTLGWAVRSTRIQKEAVKAIRQARGGVTYGSQYLGGTLYDFSGKPWWCPRWLVKQIGIDYVDSPVQVVFSNDTSKCTDLIVAQVAKLGRPEWLVLSGNKITDAGIRNLSNVTSLTRISLCFTAISDSGLAYLCGLNRVEALDLAYTGVGDSGMRQLAGLTNLMSLRLTRTKVTDAGVSSLRGLTKLLYLDLSETQITDACVSEIQKELPSVKITR